MKKSIILALLAIFCASTASAQYAVGDIFEKDDVKGIVFYVDDSGEHGLAITAQKVMTKEEIKAYYAEQKAKRKAMTKEQKAEMKAFQKEMSANIVKYYADLQSKCGLEGKENAAIIKQYCAENNINMEYYFPNHHWASTLGEGWFIPGEKEAALYSEFISFGVGKPCYKGIKWSEMQKKYNDLNNAMKSNSGYENYILPQTVGTSTIGSQKFLGKEYVSYKTMLLRVEEHGVGLVTVKKYYYDIAVNLPGVCNIAIAVCAF